MNLRSNLKYILHFHRLTQDEFGAQFGLKKTIMSSYIRGRSLPSLELLINIAEKYNITLDELVVKDLKEIEPWTIYVETGKNTLEGKKEKYLSGSDTVQEEFVNNLVKAISYDEDAREQLKVFMATYFSKLFVENIVEAFSDDDIINILKKRLEI